MGVMLGFVRVEYKRTKQLRFSWLLSIVTWILLLGMLAATLFLPSMYNSQNNTRDPDSYINTKTEGWCFIY